MKIMSYKAVLNNFRNKKFPLFLPVILEIFFSVTWWHIKQHEQFPIWNFWQMLASWMIVTGATLTALGWGGVSGTLCLALLFSLCLVELYVIHLMGKIDYGIMEALAAPTEAYDYIPTISFFLISLIIVVFLLKKSFRRSYYIFWIGILLTILGVATIFDLEKKTQKYILPRISKSYQAGNICFSLGKQNHHCYYANEPDTYWRFGRGVHDLLGNFIGDTLGVILISFDQGRSSLPIHGHKTPSSLQDIKSSPLIKHIIIVVGESESPLRMSAFGWRNPTTPLLDADIKRHKACIIKHAHAAAPATRWGVLPSISFWDPRDMNAAMTDKNLLELAQEQKMYTGFLSSVSEMNIYTSMSGYIAKHADSLFDKIDNFYIDPKNIFKHSKSHSHFLDFTTDINSPQDNILRQPLQSLLFHSSKEKGQFYIVHLMGSHFPYAHRYEKQDKAALQNATDYERSIHYTDRFLEFLNTLAAKAWGDDYLIFYSSDHSENLSRSLHAMYNGQQQYLTPVVIYGHNAEEWCNRADALREYNSWFSTNMNKYLIAEMLGYRIDPKVLRTTQEADLVWRMEHVDSFDRIPKLTN